MKILNKNSYKIQIDENESNSEDTTLSDLASQEQNAVKKLTENTANPQQTTDDETNGFVIVHDKKKSNANNSETKKKTNEKLKQQPNQPNENQFKPTVSASSQIGYDTDSSKPLLSHNRGMIIHSVENDSGFQVKLFYF